MSEHCSVSDKRIWGPNGCHSMWHSSTEKGAQHSTRRQHDSVMLTNVSPAPSHQMTLGTVTVPTRKHKQ